MGIETTTTHVCDICNRRSEKSDFNNGSECGSAKLTVDGSIGGRGYDGAWGGYGVHLDCLICFDCLRGFQTWFEATKNA